jgi:hypothetical protein
VDGEPHTLALAKYVQFGAHLLVGDTFASVFLG